MHKRRNVLEYWWGTQEVLNLCLPIQQIRVPVLHCPLLTRTANFLIHCYKFILQVVPQIFLSRLPETGHLLSGIWDARQLPKLDAVKHMSREFITPFIHVVCNVPILSCEVIVDNGFFFALSWLMNRIVINTLFLPHPVQLPWSKELIFLLEQSGSGVARFVCLRKFLFNLSPCILFSVNTIVLPGCFDEHYISSLS